MKNLVEVEDVECFRALVLQDLKDLGIKPPKTKTKKRDSLDYQPGVFGTHLNLVSTAVVDHLWQVPKFLVEACSLLEKHISEEGLFRKSGGVSRQKKLKEKAENGEEFNDAHPFDVAGLVKQFFRELPDPLLTSELHDTFLKCHQLPEHARVTAILLLCHLLPLEHLSTLRFIMIFLRKVADKAEVNKMNVANLAVCLAPNLLHANTGTDKMKETESKLLQMQINIVKYLIENADAIGMVSDSLSERTSIMVSCFHSEDELEKSDGQICDERKNTKGKKKRSGSLKGFVSNLSNSFSKWRRDSKGNNQSNVTDKPATSMIDKSSVMPNDGNHKFENYPLCIDAKPNLMRKRKEEDDLVPLGPSKKKTPPKLLWRGIEEDVAAPFSASRKRAIMESLPNHSAPFKTPHTMRNGGHPDFLKAPDINFADRSDMLFTGQTPTRNEATTSSNVSQKVHGIIRRLSGRKAPQQSPSNQGLDSYTLLEEDGENQQHGVTPDSSKSGVQSPATSSEISLEDKAKYTKDTGNVSLGIKSRLRRSMPNALQTGLQSQTKRRSLDKMNANDDGDESLGNRSNLRRSMPNTLRSGLRSQAKRRSLDKTNTKDDGNVSLGNKSRLRRSMPNALRSGLRSQAKQRSPDTRNTSDKVHINNAIFCTVDIGPILHEATMHRQLAAANLVDAEPVRDQWFDCESTGNSPDSGVFSLDGNMECEMVSPPITNFLKEVKPTPKIKPQLLLTNMTNKMYTNKSSMSQKSTPIRPTCIKRL